MSEKQFQTQIMQLARLNGWLVSHFHNSQKMVRRGNSYIPIGDNDAKGFPDCFLVRGSRILVWELKKELGKTTPEQDIWLEALRVAGLEARVVRPSDFDQYVIPALS